MKTIFLHSMLCAAAMVGMVVAPVSSPLNLNHAQAQSEGVPYDDELGLHSHLFVSTEKEAKRAGRAVLARDSLMASTALWFTASTAAFVLALATGDPATTLAGLSASTSGSILGIWWLTALPDFDTSAESGQSQLSLFDSGRTARRHRHANRGFLQAKALRRLQNDYDRIESLADKRETLSAIDARRLGKRKYRYGYQLAHFAAVKGDKDVLRYMIKQGFDMSAKTELLNTPFELAHAMSQINLAPVFADFHIQELQSQGSSSVGDALGAMSLRLIRQSNMIRSLNSIVNEDPKVLKSTGQPTRLGLGHGFEGAIGHTKRGDLKRLFADIILFADAITGLKFDVPDDVIYKIENMDLWIKFADEKGFTALHIAAAVGNYNVMEDLVKRGLSLDATTESGLSVRDIWSAHVETGIRFAQEYLEVIDARAPETQKLVWSDTIQNIKSNIDWLQNNGQLPSLPEADPAVEQTDEQTEQSAQCAELLS